MRILLHACCGPCLLEPYDILGVTAHVDVCYANPNIAPADEYVHRRDTLMAYAGSAGIRVFELPHEPDRWERAVASAGEARAARCRACYALRIGLVAAEAARLGYDAVATTLAVSPYQDQGAVREEGEAACRAAGVEFIASDFRDRYTVAVRRSREFGMYRQNYCGCAPSAAEAKAGHDARKPARTASSPSAVSGQEGVRA